MQLQVGLKNQTDVAKDWDGINGRATLKERSWLFWGSVEMADVKDLLSDDTMPNYLDSVLVASIGVELNVKWGSSFFLLNEVLILFSHISQYIL